jgi:hypothetical protein
VDLNNNLPQAGLDGGYFVLWNKAAATDHVDMRGPTDPAIVIDTLVLNGTNFFPGFNHYGDLYAFQSDGPNNVTTLKKWWKSGNNLVATQIGSPDDYLPGAQTIAGPRNIHNRCWVSSDGAAIAWCQISTDRGISWALDIIRAYNPADGTLLWEWDAQAAGTLIPTDSFVLLSASRFFCANATSDNLELRSDTGSVLDTMAGYDGTYKDNGHFTGSGINGVGYCRSIVNEDNTVSIYFNQIETTGDALAWARAPSLLNTDWVGTHLNAGPTPIPQGYKDTATAMSVSSWGDQIVAAPNMDLSEYPAEEITFYWMDPSAGSYEISDPVLLPGDGPFRLFSAGAYHTYVVEFDQPNATYLMVKQPVGPNDVRVPYAPENAATALRTLRELNNRNWSVWFTIDGNQTGAELLIKGAYNQYYLGYEIDSSDYDYNQRMQYLVFSGATNTWRTDLLDPAVIADLGTPTYSPGPWQAIYDISTVNSNRVEPVHSQEYIRLINAILAKTTGRTLLAVIVDGSKSYETDSGFTAWQGDNAAVPGIFAATKQTVDAMIARGITVDTIVIRCSGWDSQVPTNVLDFDGTTISVGGDGHRYGDDEADYDTAPTFLPTIPAVTVYTTTNTVFDTNALKTAWFATPTEPDSTMNDMAETMLEGMRHAIGYASNDAYPTPYSSYNMLVATDSLIKFPVDQYFPGYDWPDLPLVTQSFGPISIDANLSGTLFVDPRRFVEGSTSVDITMSAWLIPVFKQPVVGDL